MRLALIAVAAMMTAALNAAETPKETPDVDSWHGANLLGLFAAVQQKPDPRIRGEFEECYFRWFKEWGFNFARLPMDYRFFLATNDWSRLKLEGFEKVDRAVAWGRKYGVHVQLAIHRAPGYTVCYWDPEKGRLQSDPEPQAAFIRIWSEFARRYRGIPNSELSFNLVNEPTGFTEAQFIDVFGRTIDAIRAIDPGRFVMLDGNNCASTPVPHFYDVPLTGQAFRGYTPHAISHYLAWYIGDQPETEPTWPFSGEMAKRDGWNYERPEVTLGKFAGARDSGYPVMIGEFGCYNKLKHETCLAWMEDCLKLWNARGLGWAIWNVDGAFGFMDSDRVDVEYEDFEGHKLDRKMLDLLRKYCGPGKRSVSARSTDRLPVVDISGETERQVVIAEGAKDRYEGHPTTLLADDGETMFCVWTTGHGGPCGQMARSEDGGLTWRRMDDKLPAVYSRTHKNCPTLQKVKGPDGKTRYFIYSAKVSEGSGLAIMMSEDLGRTWSELPCQPQLSAHMPPTGLMELKGGTVALFGQVFKNRERALDRSCDDQAVWMAISRDGGRSYGEMHQVMKAENRNLCEPCCLRSPDGGSLVLLARENRHQGRSMMSFSHDEGTTWTKPVDTPWALTGDRHEGVLLPDGRYVIAFRDQAIGSPTRGQFMAWVGTFDDLVKGREGLCRIHLLRHHGLGTVFPGSDWDTGYPGVELLPDGTIVCTTYSRHFDDDRQSSVVSTRFKISEIDRRRR